DLRAIVREPLIDPCLDAPRTLGLEIRVAVEERRGAERLQQRRFLDAGARRRADGRRADGAAAFAGDDDDRSTWHRGGAAAVVVFDARADAGDESAPDRLVLDGHAEVVPRR